MTSKYAINRSRNDLYTACIRRSPLNDLGNCYRVSNTQDDADWCADITLNSEKGTGEFMIVFKAGGEEYSPVIPLTANEVDYVKICIEQSAAGLLLTYLLELHDDKVKTVRLEYEDGERHIFDFNRKLAQTYIRRCTDNYASSYEEVRELMQEIVGTDFARYDFIPSDEDSLLAFVVNEIEYKLSSLQAENSDLKRELKGN